MAEPTPRKTLEAFEVDERLMDRYEDGIRKSSAAYSQSIFNAVEGALSDLSVGPNGLIDPTAINQVVLDRFQRQAEDLLRASGLEDQIGDVIDIYNQRIETLNRLTEAAGFTGATVTDFERFESITRRVNDFAQRVAGGAGPIADEVRNATLKFRNDLSRGGRVRFRDLVDTLETKAGILPNYAKTIGNTELMAIDREGRFIQSKQAGIDYLRYTGVLDNLTRPFCRAHVGEVKSRAEWQAMYNNTGPQPVSRYAGGYNCRHRLILWLGEWSGIDVAEPDRAR